jgi:hypothetical protein
MVAAAPVGRECDHRRVTVIATLIVTRSAGSLTDRLRHHEVVVDDVPRGRVAAGKSLSLALAPGRHRVRAGRGEEIQVHLGPGAQVRLSLDGVSLRAEE